MQQPQVYQPHLQVYIHYNLGNGDMEGEMVEQLIGYPLSDIDRMSSSLSTIHWSLESNHILWIYVSSKYPLINSSLYTTCCKLMASSTLRDGSFVLVLYTRVVSFTEASAGIVHPPPIAHTIKIICSNWSIVIFFES